MTEPPCSDFREWGLCPFRRPSAGACSQAGKDFHFFPSDTALEAPVAKLARPSLPRMLSDHRFPRNPPNPPPLPPPRVPPTRYGNQQEAARRRKMAIAAHLKALGVMGMVVATSPPPCLYVCVLQRALSSPPERYDTPATLSFPVACLHVCLGTSPSLSPDRWDTPPQPFLFPCK